MAGGMEGLGELIAKFGNLAEVVVNQHLEKAVGNSTKMVQREAKLLCPVNNGELRNSIKTVTEVQDGIAIGTCYTNKTYAAYVEFGTGPKGEQNHEGTSPNVIPAYTQKPWYIPADKIDPADAEKYHFQSYIYHLDGYLAYEKEFYRTYGQPAQPFMYPALKNNEERATRNIANYLARKIREECGK